MRLEDLHPNAAIRGLLSDGTAIVVSVQWHGADALTLIFRDPAGRIAEEILYREDETRLDIVESGRPWSFDGDGALFRLVLEAHRVRLAHLFDPALAVHTSLVEPLPHQITAVYEAMLPREPLRFLLADDRAATIAGLSHRRSRAASMARSISIRPGSAETRAGLLKRSSLTSPGWSVPTCELASRSNPHTIRRPGQRDSNSHGERPDVKVHELGVREGMIRDPRITGSKPIMSLPGGAV